MPSRTVALGSKKRKRQEDNQLINSNRKMKKLQQTETKTPSGEKENSTLPLAQSNIFAANIQAEMSQRQTSNNNPNENWADEIEEVIETQPSTSVMKSISELENSLVENTENWVLDDPDQMQSRTDLLHMETYDTDTNSVTYYTSPISSFSTNKDNPYRNKDSPNSELRGNIPIDFQEDITKEIKNTLEHVGKISSIKPLVFEGTSILSNQWVVIFDISDDPDIPKQMPRFIIIMNQKVTTEWREAPKLCFFCDAEGHIKKKCQQYKKAQKIKTAYQSYKRNKTSSFENSVLYNHIDTNNVNLTKIKQLTEYNDTDEQSQSTQKKTIVTQTESIIQNNMLDSQQEELSDFDINKTDNHMADLETLLREEKTMKI
ncbi:16340_t:CDS:2 [Racocetra fulgida]|uniref:16340_t:CDS:1 n=1 Tax=Racocetra fulgida TaxID=60492 RepID=A0A9N9FJF0_9GLOM|nr:16340_t:CDS:2 [Racocetra fulgida]